MSVLLQAAAFVLGTYLAIRMIAALHQVNDLWYAIGRTYPRVIGGLLGWGTAILAAVRLLDGAHRSALVAGLLGFLGFYLSLYVIRYPLLRAWERRSRRPES